MKFDDGFIQRFQLAFYPDAPKWKLVDRAPDNKAISQAHECFARLDNLSINDGETIVLRFSDEAQEFFYKWWGELESDIENGEFEHPALVAHFSKYRSPMPSADTRAEPITNALNIDLQTACAERGNRAFACSFIRTATGSLKVGRIENRTGFCILRLRANALSLSFV